MATAALCGNDLPDVVPEQEIEFPLKRHRPLQIIDKGFWVRFVVMPHIRHLSQI